MERYRYAVLFGVIPLFGFAVDFLTKQMVILNLCQNAQTVEVLGFFNLVCVLNTGVSFGIFAGVPYGARILLFVTIAVLLLLHYLLLKERKVFMQYSYSLIIAGAWGNIIDRFLHGGVVDFLDFYIKNWHYPAFNVADILIFCGVFGIIIFEFKKK